MSEHLQHNDGSAPPTAADGLLRLHIGGRTPRAGWKILDVNPGPHVDFVGNCRDLSRFADGSVAEVYASDDAKEKLVKDFRTIAQ